MVRRVRRPSFVFFSVTATRPGGTRVVSGVRPRRRRPTKASARGSVLRVRLTLFASAGVGVAGRADAVLRERVARRGRRADLGRVRRVVLTLACFWAGFSAGFWAGFSAGFSAFVAARCSASLTLTLPASVVEIDASLALPPALITTTSCGGGAVPRVATTQATTTPATTSPVTRTIQGSRCLERGSASSSPAAAVSDPGRWRGGSLGLLSR